MSDSVPPSAISKFLESRGLKGVTASGSSLLSAFTTGPNRVMYIGGGVVVALLLALAVWYFFIRDDDDVQ